MKILAWTWTHRSTATKRGQSLVSWESAIPIDISYPHIYHVLYVSWLGYCLSFTDTIYQYNSPGTLFTKWLDVLLPKLANDRNPNIGCLYNNITWKFYRRSWQNVVRVPVKYQGDRTTFKVYLLALISNNWNSNNADNNNYDDKI